MVYCNDTGGGVGKIDKLGFFFSFFSYIAKGFLIDNRDWVNGEGRV